MKTDKTKTLFGFTLVEVMVAVVVLAVGISTILALIGGATRSVNSSRIITIQTALARLAMVQIENRYWQKEADRIDKSGDFGSDFPDFHYSVEITEDIDEKIPALHQVDLTVHHDSKRVEPYIITTYLLDFSR